MSSGRGSHSPVSVEAQDEPRKKGSRGGKRSVTHLSKAQLARKRANDREAQRNIRQRTKDHIMQLEKKVKELEQGNGRQSSLERAYKRIRELEDELSIIRGQQPRQLQPGQLQPGQQQPGQLQPGPQQQINPDMPEDLLMPSKNNLEWMADSDNPNQWSGNIQSHIQALSSSSEMPTTNTTYTVAGDQIYPDSATIGYDDETSQSLATTTASSLWKDPMMFAQQAPQGLSKHIGQWGPYSPPITQTPRYPDLQPPGFNELMSRNDYNSTTCWQNQSPAYLWQLSQKIKSEYLQHGNTA